MADADSVAALAVIVAVLNACGGGGSGGGDPVAPPRITTIAVSPSDLTLEALGATAQLEATARDQSGSTRVDEFGPSLAFTGAADEFGLWSIFRIDTSTRSPRPPSTGGEYFFTLQDAYRREIYREPLALLTTTHGDTRPSWAVRVPAPEQPPAFLAILDAQGTPLFIEPIDVQPYLGD